MRSHVITRRLLSAKAVDSILLVILCQLNMAPIVTFRLYECSRFQMYF